jgi:DNA mismatch repair protein MutS2
MMGERSGGSLLGRMARLVLTGRFFGTEPGDDNDLEQLVFPDLLSPQTGPGPDPEHLLNQIDLAFLGRASAGELDTELDAMPVGASRWQRSHFADDLFISELLKACLVIKIRGQKAPVHRAFLERVLTHPPDELSSCRYRQGILRELDEQMPLVQALETLFGRIHLLLSLLMASRDDARLKPVRFRLDVLGAFRAVVEQMAVGFAAATSGLRRIHETGESIRQSPAYRRMVDLLDHHSSMATLRLDVVISANGKLRHLEISELRECKKNPFYRRPLRRWWDRLRVLFHRYSIEPEELVDRLVMGTYHQVAPALVRVVQLVCHLEIYLAARTFAADTRSRGLQVCLPELAPDTNLELHGLFNPLLLALTRPVPSDLEMSSRSIIALVTGPNSGGKTRLLQAVGIAQVLAQSGIYAPCIRARMPFVKGLFASIIELDRADQSEGRLGTELVRLRALFEQVPPGSLVLLDELCAGTNPSEAIEIVDMVLRLLRQLKPVAFVTTHFLDFAQQLYAEPAKDGSVFLQAEVDAEHGATFRFIPGVASTSLAVGTAQRLGMTFSELEHKLKQRVSS